MAFPAASGDEDSQLLVSGKSLVSRSCPTLLHLHQLKACFGLPATTTVDEVARAFIRLSDRSDEKGESSDYFDTFLTHVACLARNKNNRMRANQILSALFFQLDLRDESPRGKVATAVSSHEWNKDVLDHTNFRFRDVDAEEFCRPFRTDLPDKLKDYVERNCHVDGSFVKRGDAGAKTKLSCLLEFVVVHAKENEAGVDDLLCHLLSVTLPEELLIKTRYKMPLRMSKTFRVATADVIVMKIDDSSKSGFEIGILVTKDKAENRIANENGRGDAEAQMVGQGIAACQQPPDWRPHNDEIHMIRVIGTYVTFYRATFDIGTRNDVEIGSERTEAVFIDRCCHPGDPDGYDLRDVQDRLSIIRILYSIGQTLIGK